jgi:hypothetical protein
MFESITAGAIGGGIFFLIVIAAMIAGSILRGKQLKADVEKLRGRFGRPLDG